MRKGILAVLSVLAAAALFILASCEEGDFDDPMKAVQRYFEQLVRNGDRNVDPTKPLAYDVGERVLQDGVNDTTVKLIYAASGDEVSGAVLPSAPVYCQQGNAASGICATAVAFYPGGQSEENACSLFGDTLYYLVIDGLTIFGGDPLDSITVEFFTAEVDEGSSVTYCGSGPLYAWWTIDDLDADDGMTLGIGGDSPWSITSYGIQAYPDNGYYGYNAFMSSMPGVLDLQISAWPPGGSFYQYQATPYLPPYTPMVRIRNSDGSMHTIPAGASIVMTSSIGATVNVTLPAGDTVPAGESLLLYVGNDGSSYYAVDGNTTGGDYSVDSTTLDNCQDPCTAFGFPPPCPDPSVGCPMLSPPDAFANPAAATP